MSRSGSTLVLGLAALALLAALGCDDEDYDHFEYEAQSPLTRVEGYGSSIVFYTAPAVSWYELAPIELFEGLRPGMTTEEAKTVAGTPDQETNRLPGRSAIFRRAKGNIIVAYSVSSSGSDEIWKWRLWFEPTAMTYGELLHPAIAAHLGGRLRDRLEVVIMAAEGPGMTIVLHGDKVASIHWLPYGTLEPNSTDPAPTEGAEVKTAPPAPKPPAPSPPSPA